MKTAPNSLTLIALFILFWSLEIFVTKIAFMAGAKVFPFTIQSSIFALLTLSVWVIPRQGKELYTLVTQRKQLLAQILVANAIHYAVGSFLYCFGVSLTSAINVAFLVTLCTPITAVLAKFILAESIPAQKAILLFTLLVGAYVLTTNLEAIVPYTGDLLIVGAAFFWSLGNVLIRKALRDSDVSGEMVSLLKHVVGIPLFLLAKLIADQFPHAGNTLFVEPIFQLDYVAFAAVSGILAALLWIFLYRALKIAESAYVSMLGMATPVIVSVLAVVFLGETMTRVQAVGAIIILVSGVMTHRGNAKEL